MPRIPRGLHSPAGAYSPGMFRWGPVARPIQRLPVQLYQRRISGVPLTGGQGQTVIGGWTGVSGSATGPGSFQTITQTAATIAAGTYTVAWTVTLAGTIGGAELNNFRLVLGGAAPVQFLVESVNAAAAGTYPQTPFTFTAPVNGTQLNLTVGPTNGTAGSIYGGTLTGQGGSGLISVGPQGLQNVWYPAQAVISTTSGINDNSTCSAFLGPAGIPITLVGTAFPGGAGTIAVAVPPMSPGQYLIFQWTGANPGDVASVNVIGTMDSVGPV